MKVYRGYNKDYPNWGMRDGQNHIWTTDDLDYAIMYANIFDNGGVVEFEIDDSKVNYASEYDYEDIIDDEFGADPIDADNQTCQLIIDAGYNVLGFDTSDYDVYLLLDKNLIKSAREIDYKNHIDNQIDEVLKLSGVELNNKLLESVKYVNEQKSFTKFTTSSYDIKKYLENHKRVRILYDKVNDWYFFDESVRVVHSRLLDDAISLGFYDSDMPNKLIHDYEYEGFILISVDNEWDFQDFVNDGYMFAYIYDTYNIYDRDGLYKETPLYKVLGEPKQIVNIYEEVYGDEEINEVLKNVGVQIQESYFTTDKGEQIFYTKSESIMMRIIKNKFIGKPIRVYYDFTKKLYVFGNAFELIHVELLEKMLENTNIYPVKSWYEDGYNEDKGYWKANFLTWKHLEPNCAMFQIIFDNDIQKYTTYDGYLDGYWTKYNDMIIICRQEELKKCEKVPMLWNNRWNSNKYDPLNQYNIKNI